MHRQLPSVALHPILWPFRIGALTALQPFSILARIPGIFHPLRLFPYTPYFPTYSSPPSSMLLRCGFSRSIHIFDGALLAFHVLQHRGISSSSCSLP